jgi:hypothetical protein
MKFQFFKLFLMNTKKVAWYHNALKYEMLVRQCFVAMKYRERDFMYVRDMLI